jgi:hypothetical protein
MDAGAIPLLTEVEPGPLVTAQRDGSTEGYDGTLHQRQHAPASTEHAAPLGTNEADGRYAIVGARGQFEGGPRINEAEGYGPAVGERG